MLYSIPLYDTLPAKQNPHAARQVYILLVIEFVYIGCIKYKGIS